MNISITGRHLEVTEGLREYVKKKVRKLKYYFEHILNVHLILEIEKLEHKAEVTLQSDEKIFVCEVNTHDMYNSLDILFVKLERQIVRNKEKYKQRKGRGGGRELLSEIGDVEFAGVREEEEEGVKITKVKEVPAKPKRAVEALLQLGLNRHKFEIFNNEDKKGFHESIALMEKDNTYSLIERRNGRWERKNVKLEGERMEAVGTSIYEIEELDIKRAIDKVLENPELDYVIFNDPEGYGLSIIYTRSNKSLALITSGGGVN